MNEIGFGIMCFGDDHYYQMANEKLNEIIDFGYDCYALTDNRNLIHNKMVNIIPYVKSYRSYHDKLILPKHILKEHQISILIDADTQIKDYTFLRDLKRYQFKKGISYIETLLNHRAKKEFVKDFNLPDEQWGEYKRFAKEIYPNYEELETIWEYFMVINRDGFNYEGFYEIFEKLQLTKDFCDLRLKRKVNGAGEGISTMISAILSNTQIQRDDDLYNLLKKYIK